MPKSRVTLALFGLLALVLVAFIVTGINDPFGGGGAASGTPAAPAAYWLMPLIRGWKDGIFVSSLTLV